MLLNQDTFTSRGVGGNIDIGAGISPTGSASVSGGVWTVVAGGGDIYGTADTFHFVSQSQSGNFTFSCRVATQQNTNGYAKAGIMFRNSVANNDVYYAIFLTPSNGVQVQWRTASGGTTGSLTNGAFTAPTYLQIVRTGNVFVANTSPDGSTWTLVPGSSQTISAANTAMLVGLANCSHNNGTGNTSTFDNLSSTITPVTNTWGTASDGSTWNNNNLNALLGVTSTAGAMYSSSADSVLVDGASTAADQEVWGSIAVANASDKAGVVARLTGSGGSANYYRLAWYGGNLHLEKNLAGTVTQIATAVAETMTVGTFYSFKLRCVGTTIEGRYWQTSGSEPTTWTISGTDSSQASGSWGVYGNATTTTPVLYDTLTIQDGFITRSTTNLIYNNANFRFSGGNVYWCGLEEVPAIQYPTNFEVNDAFATLAEMGATVVRIHTMGISVGNALSVEPTHNSYNTAAFTSMDYAIKKAGDYGLKVVIPLVDNWAYYHGGKHHYTDFLSKANSPTVFYTDATTISDFQAYCGQIINRVNSITGIPYYADSTILCWETGNELDYYPASGTLPDTSWTTSMVTYIKGQDKNHLVMSGTSAVNSAEFGISGIDIFTKHYYPPNTTNMTADAASAAGTSRVFIIGEYDWTGQFGGSSLSSFLSSIEGNTNVSGDLFWGLYAHNPTVGWNEYAHDYTMYYPGTGETKNRASIMQTLRTHAYTMSGVSVPAAGTPAAPVLSANKRGGHVVDFVWPGVAFASTYSLEISKTGPSGSFSVLSTTDDWHTPVTHFFAPGSTRWARVRAANTAGGFGSYSNVVQISVP